MQQDRRAGPSHASLGYLVGDFLWGEQEKVTRPRSERNALLVPDTRKAGHARLANLENEPDPLFSKVLRGLCLQGSVVSVVKSISTV